MTLHHGDCLDVMAAMEPESVDAIVTDPPYGLEFMGKEWDRLDGDAWRTGGNFTKPGIGDRATAWPSFGSGDTANATCATCGGRMRGKKRCECEAPDWRVKGKPLGESKADTRQSQGVKMQEWHRLWAVEALRVAKPSAYLLAFGGTRTVHRMTVALEDAGWVIRDMLVWGYASGFPKSKASLKPAWEPIVMARKPGPLRMLNIDECRIPFVSDEDRAAAAAAASIGFGRSMERGTVAEQVSFPTQYDPETKRRFVEDLAESKGRWPANIVLTDPIFDGGWEGVVGGGETTSGKMQPTHVQSGDRTVFGSDAVAGYTTIETYGDSGTYSRFFIIPKADRADREPVLGGLPQRVVSVWGGDEDDLSPGKKSTRPRRNQHPTVKPTDLMRHLVRLVTPTGGVVLDPFLGSGTTALAAELEGFDWIGIEREAEYVAIAEARLNGTQRGLGLGA